MCGVMSAISLESNVLDSIIAGLRRLEYRGYDSSGVSYIDQHSSLVLERSVGGIDALESKIDPKSFSRIGIGHTRWATHGVVSEDNAHPHVSNGISIVHNGIIENHTELKDELCKDGAVFASDTDSEVIAHLISKYFTLTGDFAESFRRAISRLVGTYAIAAICRDDPNTIIGARKDSPMAIGFSPNNDVFYIASDSVALSSLCSQISYLDEGDMVVCNRNDQLICKIFSSSGKEVKRDVLSNKISLSDVSKGDFEDFMAKEIFDEPNAIANTFNSILKEPFTLDGFNGVSIIACGTSFYAGLIAKYLIEEFSGLHVDVEIASEFRNRSPVLQDGNCYVFISQSGETLDTLAAMRLVKSSGFYTLAIVNVDGSSIAREADRVIKTEAGTEVGVASTKTLAAQLIAIFAICQATTRRAKNWANINIDLIKKSINATLDSCPAFETLARKIKDSRNLIYIGRGVNYPIALEGALKVKELAYIGAEGYPAGEIKHGPIAMVDDCIYTIVIAPLDNNFDKTLSNTQEILARDSKIIFITTQDSIDKTSSIRNHKNVDVIFLPNIDRPFHVFQFITAVHLLAYYTAKLKGHNVDRPRNLAKSVTVE
jgi:glucosamine--fructose-6-phosphate aminotransferase (isomerizing)